MLVTYPAACKPHAQNWTLTQPVQRSRSAWTGREQRLVMTGSRWSVSCEVIAMRLATYQAWASFMAQLEGSANTFKVPATTATQSGPATATWAMDGTGVVANYVLYSEQFDNASWFKLNSAIVTANQYTAPDGTLTADQLNTSGSTTAAIQSDTGTAAAASTTYNASVYLYAPTAGYLITMVLQTTTGVGGTTVTQKTLTAGWARYDVTLTTTAGATGNLRMLLARATTGSAANFGVWGAQVMLGSTPTTYVRTTSATATSLAAFKVTGLTVSSTNMTEGQMLTIDERLYTLTADVVADSGGKAVVSVKPNLAAATTAASVAYVQNPYAVVTMTEAPTVSVEPGPIYRVSFNAEEVY